MNKECDYSAAYVTLTTSDGLEANGMTFTIGRGNDVSPSLLVELDDRLRIESCYPHYNSSFAKQSKLLLPVSSATRRPTSFQPPECSKLGISSSAILSIVGSVPNAV